MKVNFCLVIYIGVLLALVGLGGCTPAKADLGASVNGGPATLATQDRTATAVAQIIEHALSATPLSTSQSASMHTALPNLSATETADGQGQAAAVAATLTAQPTTTPTPNAAATETTEAQRLATIVAATLTARPTATPDLAATATAQGQHRATAVAATLTAQPTATSTATPTEDLEATQTAETNRLATAVVATIAAQPTVTAPNPPVPMLKVLAHRPNEQELRNGSSLWSLTTFQDLYSPGTRSYDITLTNQDWRWTFAWCATDETRLAAILQPLTVNMLIDDMALSDELLLQHQGITKTGDHCYYWSTFLTNWQPGAAVKLDVSYFLADAMNDGRRSYAAGQYHQVLNVSVR